MCINSSQTSCCETNVRPKQRSPDPVYATVPYHLALASLNIHVPLTQRSRDLTFAVTGSNKDFLSCSAHHAQLTSVADPEGGTSAPPLRTKIFLISCSFSENLANLYAGAPSWRVDAPSYGKSWIRPWNI